MDQNYSGPRRLAVYVVIIVILIAIAGVIALVVTSPHGQSSTTTTASTYISSGADTILANAMQSNPAGFVVQSSKPSGQGNDLQKSDWSKLAQADGSDANATVIVYQTMNASMNYFDRFVESVSGLPGYSVISSDLSSFQQFGKCYAYGEDVEGIAVVNGLCTKGNVFLEVHLDSSISFSDLESDLTSLMGALYQAST